MMSSSNPASIVAGWAQKAALELHKPPAKPPAAAPKATPQPSQKIAPAPVKEPSDDLDVDASKRFALPGLSVADVRDGSENTRPLSELGNAMRLFDTHGDKLRYVADAAIWIIWRDGAWVWDDGAAYIRELAASLPSSIYKEGASFPPDQSQHFAKWARTSQKANTIAAAVNLLADQHGIRITLAQIDADSMLVGFNNARQVIDLRTGQVRLARHVDYVTKSLRPNYVGESAEAVRWQSFLPQIFNKDPELIDWIHRWCGYMLTGSTQEQIFLFLFGLGANGKSVYAEALRHILADYARTVAPETLSESRRQAGSASPDLADLIGARLAMSSETEDGAALAETFIKCITGGDTLTARRLHRDPVQFVPAFKLVVLGNHRPVIRGTDYGLWRRVRMVPFTRTFGESERDPHLLDKLKAEAPHILRWMIDGCIAWREKGLTEVPAVVREQTAAYQQEQDIVGQWLSECTITRNGYETEVGALYASYQCWAEKAGLKPYSKISMARKLPERGFTMRSSNGRRFWQGIALQDVSSNASEYRDEF